MGKGLKIQGYHITPRDEVESRLIRNIGRPVQVEPTIFASVPQADYQQNVYESHFQQLDMFETPQVDEQMHGSEGMFDSPMTPVQGSFLPSQPVAHQSGMREMTPEQEIEQAIEDAAEIPQDANGAFEDGNIFSEPGAYGTGPDNLEEICNEEMQEEMPFEQQQEQMEQQQQMEQMEQQEQMGPDPYLQMQFMFQGPMF